MASSSAPPLNAEALAKRDARRRRQQEEGGEDPADASINNKDQSEGESMWENEYTFSSFSIKVMEEFGGESCVGGTQWPGGVRIARYLDTPSGFPPGSLVNRTLLDLGSGCGLVSAVAAKLGAKVLAVDKDIVMTVLTDNLSSNHVLADEYPAPRHHHLPTRAEPLIAGKVVVEELYWGHGASHPLAPFDIIIAAACLYMPKTVPLLLETIYLLSGPESTILLAAIIGEKPLTAFIKQVGRWFEYEARDDEGKVIGRSVEGNLSRSDIATRVLHLRRKEVVLPPSEEVGDGQENGKEEDGDR